METLRIILGILSIMAMIPLLILLVLFFHNGEAMKYWITVSLFVASFGGAGQLLFLIK